MCTDCEARRKLARDAWVKGKIGEAAGHIAKGAAEMVGMKTKTGSSGGGRRRVEAGQKSKAASSTD